MVSSVGTRMAVRKSTLTLAADLSGGLDGSVGGVGHRLFGHPGPVALDQVAPRPVSPRHGISLAPRGDEGIGCFPMSAREGAL